MPTSNTIKAALAALLFCAAPACARVMGEAVATINGKPLLMSEFRKNVEAKVEYYKHTAPALLDPKDAMQAIEREVLDSMVSEQLLLQEAEKEKVRIVDRDIDEGVDKIKKRFNVDEAGRPLSPADAEKAFAEEMKQEGLTVEKFRERVRGQLLAIRYADQTIRPKLSQPTEAQLQKLYEDTRLLLKGDTAPLKNMSEPDAKALEALTARIKDMGAERIFVRHILVRVPKDAPMPDKKKALDKIKEAKAKLDKGEAFGVVAASYSEDPDSAKQDGKIGYIIRGWMPKEFEEKAFSLEVGKVSDPVETDFGYHIIKVDSKNAAQDLSLEDLRKGFMEYLTAMQQQREFQALIERLRKKASITENLPAAPAAPAAATDKKN